MIVPEKRKVLLGLQGVTVLLLSFRFTGFYRVLPVFTVYYPVFFTGFYEL